MNGRTTTRITVVEDDPLVRDYPRDILAEVPEIEIAAMAGSLAEARRLVSSETDLFLIDIGLPDGCGLDLVPDIRAGGGARVLMLTSFSDRQTVIAAIEAGADGYLLKDSSAQILVQGIQVTLQGGAPISPAAAVFLLERLRRNDAGGTESGDKQLTEREIELLRCFSRGASYKEAARELGISSLTVGSHVKAIYRKLAVHSRGEAVYRAVRDHKLDLSR